MSELKIAGAMIGSSLLIDLKDDGKDILKGPFSVKAGDESVIDAQMALLAMREHFSLAVDIANPTDPSYRSHAEIDITGKRSVWDGTIDAPKDAIPYSTITDALGGAYQSPDDLIKK
jgi:hypothetical protein